MTFQTELKFYRIDENNPHEKDRSYIPLGSARGCRQTLEPISPAEAFRTLEGKLVPFGSQDKYRSLIECHDIHPIALEGLWPGVSLKVECLASLMTGFIHKGARVGLKRPPVKGSLLLHKEDGTCEFLQDPPDQELHFSLAQGSGYISYRPCLEMILKKFWIKNHEWEGEVGWQMELEEI